MSILVKTVKGGFTMDRFLGTPYKAGDALEAAQEMYPDAELTTVFLTSTGEQLDPMVDLAEDAVVCVTTTPPPVAA